MKLLILCEGPNELAVVQMLLDADCFVFSRDDLLGLRPYHARQIDKSSAVKLELNIYSGSVKVLRIGDVMSDDALKGGQNVGDMSVVYDMENFKVQSNNALLLGFYRAQYQGIARCNLVLDQVAKMEPDTTMNVSLQQRILGEASFLRALYYFRLVRVFGGVPYVDFIIDSPSKWQQPRATAEAIYGQIVKDLEEAEPDLWLKSEYDASDLGRATKGAAQAMLLKVNLYRHNYDEAYKWGTTFMEEQASEYDLNPEYLYNFAIEGENGIESVFEVQYVEEGTSDWGTNIPNGADGATRGNMSTVWTRPRNTNTIVVDRDDTGATILAQKGYGYNRPSVDLYNEFEAGDPRREYTIIDIPDSDIQNQAEEIYLGNRYINRKQSGYYYDNGNYNLYYKLDHDTRSPVNRREIRFSDVLLLYAEACLESGKDLDKGAAALNRVRNRVGLGPVSLNEANLRHERRVELAMEGHRWFDLCRWGIVGDTMNAYRAKYMDEDSGTSYEGVYMREFVKGKHELFPIPYEEVRLSGLTQNPGY